MDWLSDIFSKLQQMLFEALVAPITLWLGLANRLDDAFNASGWLLAGLLQLLVLISVIGPLQRWRPAQRIADPAAVRTDILYTLIHRLGLFRLVLYFSLIPLLENLFGALRVAGLSTLQVDQLWPGVTDQALISLLIYLVLFDFVDYWIHRAQHQWNWWWQLHALHHSQRDLTMWSDNRNHLLDDVLRDTVLVCVAHLVGVAPTQFVAIVIITQLSESFQHANLKLWFGPIGERLWISPRFHRLHHAVGLGHESPIAAGKAGGPSEPPHVRNTSEPAGLAQGASAYRLGGQNYGVLLPCWDMLFGTANFDLRYHPTGIRDQVEQDRDYGRGFWAQQWLGLKRLAGHG